MAAKRQPIDKERSVSSDIVEGLFWGLLAAAITATMLYIILA
jgi:hypothetical protein